MLAIECKFSSLQAESGQSMVAGIGKNIEVFRSHYPHGENIVVVSDIDQPFERRYQDIVISFVNTQELVNKLASN